MNAAATRTTVGCFLAGLMCLACWPTPTHADGLIVVEPTPGPRPRPVPLRRQWMPLEIRRHHVETTVTDTLAVTRVDQAFYNPTGRQLEGTYIFPLPDDVAVQRFTMRMDGKEVSGELLAKDKARRIYEDFVRNMRDPALLEYVGLRMFKARVFPIPAGGEVEIALEYSQNIAIDQGMGCYRYPLNTEKFSAEPIESVSVHVRLESQVPLRNVFCPSHNVSIDRHGDHRAVVGYEERNVRPDRDLLVYYQLSDQEFGLAVLTHRTGGQDGFFVARVAPRLNNQPGKIMPKDVCFVIDTSGSMSGQKLTQAKEALRFCLNNLNDADRFNIIRFATEAQAYRDSQVQATGQAVGDAAEFVGRMSASGGTNIYAALNQALEGMDPGESRPAMIVFVTDGRPTVELTDINQIIQKVTERNRRGVRMFVFGVGNDVNTQLLDKLSEQNRGAREYVGEKENLELKLSGFFAKLAHPVLGDLAINITKVEAYDIYPRRLPDLFKGTEVVVFGRYRHAGPATVEMTGRRGPNRERFTYETEFADHQSDHDFLPRLWALRKIGHLLDEIHLHGENAELKDEIVRLSREYGIMTPYTSFLVLEDEAAGGRRGPVAFRQMLRSVPPAQMAQMGRAMTADTGKRAVRYSQDLANMKGASAAAAPAGVILSGVLRESEEMTRWSGGQARLRHVGSKTFYLTDGRWIDSTFDDKSMKLVKLEPYSDAFFNLLARHTELGRYFALAQRVLVVHQGRAYETVSG